MGLKELKKTHNLQQQVRPFYNWHYNLIKETFLKKKKKSNKIMKQREYTVLFQKSQYVT